MNQIELYRQIIDGCDEALRDVFLRRMEMSVKVAETKLGTNSKVFDSKREEEILDSISADLPPELALKARSLWRSLMRMSRGRQYHFFMLNDKSRKLAHDDFLVNSMPEGAVLCDKSHAETVKAALKREVVCADSVDDAVSALEKGAQAMAAVVVDEFSQSDSLLTKIYDRAVYINSVSATPGGGCVFTLSRNLVDLPENNMVCIAFKLDVDDNGGLAQVLEVFTDLRINVEYLQLKAVRGEDEQYVVFADINGELSSVAMRTALLQLECERPFFRVIGYRPKLAWNVR